MVKRILEIGVDDDGNVLWIDSVPVPNPGMIPIGPDTTIEDLEKTAIHGRKPTPEEKRILEEILKK